MLNRLLISNAVTICIRYPIFKHLGKAISEILVSDYAELGRYLQQRSDDGRTRWLVMAEDRQLRLQITREEKKEIGINLVLLFFIITICSWFLSGFYFDKSL